MSVTADVGSQFLSVAKKEFRANNSNIRRSLLNIQNKSTLEEKIQLDCSETCLGLLESKSQRQNWDSWPTWSQESSSRGQRRDLGARFRGLSQGLELRTAPLVLSLVRTSELRGKKAGACSSESMCCVLCLRVFICFLKAGILGEPQGRISLEYSSALQVCPLIRWFTKRSV